MKLETYAKRPAKPDSTRFIDRYLCEIIDYGGIPCTRAEAIADMQRMGFNQGSIDSWLQGYELGQRLRERRDQAAAPATNLSLQLTDAEEDGR